jgi:RND family efflux transporter MFP subunit
MAKDLPEAPAVVDPLSGKPEWAMSRRERRRAERARAGLPPPRRKWPWVVLALLVGAGVAGWLNRDTLQARFAPPVTEEPVVAAAPEAPRLTQINGDEWTEMEPATLRRTVRVIGALRPSRQADLAAETAGQVEAVLARPGDTVGEGDLLVQIDVERLTLDLDLARSTAEATRSDLALAEQQLERARQLSERGVAAASTLDEAQSNVQRLRATLAAQEEQVAVAQRALGGAAVRAPFDGVIASRSVETGNVVGAGSALLSIVDLTRMEMLAAAPVSAGASLQPGQRVELRVDGIEGRDFTGVVDRIAPVAEEGTRTLTVYVLIENEDGRLLGGMFATGIIVTAEAQDSLALPRAAIRTEGGDHVLVIEDGILARKDLTVGEEWQGGLVQVEGLAVGERVVTAALPELEPGEAVELVEY